MTVSPEEGQKKDHMPKSISVFFPAVSAEPIKRQDLPAKCSLCLLDSHYSSHRVVGPECNSNCELPKYTRCFMFFLSAVTVTCPAHFFRLLPSLLRSHYRIQFSLMTSKDTHSYTTLLPCFQVQMSDGSLEFHYVF